MAAAGGHWHKGNFREAGERMSVAPPAPTGGKKLTYTIKAENYAQKTLAEYRPEQARREDYTSEYWKGLEESRYIDSFVKKNVPDPYEAKQIQDEVRDEIRLERKLSRAAKEHGYTPLKMDKVSWASLSEVLMLKTAEELKHSTEERRDAAGNKLRGQKDTWIQLGGQDALVRSGYYSAADARKRSQELGWQTKDKADDYMTTKLTALGYGRETVGGLNYDQKRRLLAEVGHGVPQNAAIGNVPRRERERVISRATARQQLDALAHARNPRTAKGLDTWELYVEAGKRAGKPNPDYVPDELYGTKEDDSVPMYVKRPQGGRSVRLQPAQKQTNEEVPF